MAVNGVAVATLAVGSVLMWSGITGTSVLASIQDIIQGRKPRSQQTHGIFQPALTSPGGGGRPALPSSQGGGTPKPAPGPSSGSSGSSGGVFPDLTPPKVAPPVAPPPPAHTAAPKPRPWYDPFGWFS
jgi:hypothetical protein